MKLFRILLLLLFPAHLHASVIIVNGLTHVHSLKDAAAIEQGVIRVKNEGAKDSRILVYRQDLILACDQASTYLAPGSHSRSLGNGLKTNIDERNIAANEAYEVRYTIELDKAKAETGSYWEVIMIEVGEPVHEEPKNGVQVNSKVRYAIQVIVDVGTFEGPKLTYEKAGYDKVAVKQGMLRVTLKNNGRFGARTNLILEVYDSSGNKLKNTEPNTRMLYPGNCSTFEIPVNDLPAGKYDCVIIADTGKDLFGSNISLQVE